MCRCDATREQESVQSLLAAAKMQKQFDGRTDASKQFVRLAGSSEKNGKKTYYEWRQFTADEGGVEQG